MINFLSSNKNSVTSPYGLAKILKCLYAISDGSNKAKLLSYLGKEPKSVTVNSIDEANYFFSIDEYRDCIYDDVIPRSWSIELGIDGDDIRERVTKDTNGLITGFPKQEDLKDAHFLLLNNIYANFNWAREFEEVSSENVGFEVPSNFHIPFLKRDHNDKFRYFESSGLDILEIPTEDPLVNFYGFLPKGLDINTLIENKDTFASLVKQVKAAKDVKVWIPKFSLESEFDFTEKLKESIPSIFEYSKEWGFINWDLLLSEAVAKVGAIKQKSTIKISKKKIEAASSTFANMAISGCLYSPFAIPEYKVFKFNKPFLFALKHKNIDEFLFEGVVSDFNKLNDE